MSLRRRLERLERLARAMRRRFGLLDHARLRADLERLLGVESGDTGQSHPAPDFSGCSPSARLRAALAADREGKAMKALRGRLERLERLAVQQAEADGRQAAEGHGWGCFHQAVVNVAADVLPDDPLPAWASPGPLPPVAVAAAAWLAKNPPQPASGAALADAVAALDRLAGVNPALVGPEEA